MHCHRLIAERRTKRSNTTMAHLLNHCFTRHSRTLTSTACRILKDIVILQFPTNKAVISSHPTNILLYCYFQLTRGLFRPTPQRYCYFAISKKQAWDISFHPTRGCQSPEQYRPIRTHFARNALRVAAMFGHVLWRSNRATDRWTPN